MCYIETIFLIPYSPPVSLGFGENVRFEAWGLYEESYGYENLVRGLL